MPIFNMRYSMSKLCEKEQSKRRLVIPCSLFQLATPLLSSVIYEGSSPELDLSDHKNLPISIFASSIQQSVCHLLSTVGPVWQIWVAAARLRRCSSHFEILPQSLFYLTSPIPSITKNPTLLLICGYKGWGNFIFLLFYYFSKQIYSYPNLPWVVQVQERQAEV